MIEFNDKKQFTGEAFSQAECIIEQWGTLYWKLLNLSNFEPYSFPHIWHFNNFNLLSLAFYFLQRRQ